MLQKFESVPKSENSEGRVVFMDVDSLENVHIIVRQESCMRVLKTSLVHNKSDFLGNPIAYFIIEISRLFTWSVY